MSKLWEPKAEYRSLRSAKDTQKANVHLELFLPYERLYKNLTPEELLELIQDAKRLHWKVLDLRRCNLNSLPNELGELADLRILALGNYINYKTCISSGEENTFVVLPESIGQLINLQALDLRWTQVITLPKSIWQLSKLQVLNLGRSQIMELPESIKQLSSLQALYLSRTKITTLPENIKQLSNLRVMNLSCTPITVLPESIGQLSNLKTLWLQYDYFERIPHSIVKLGLPFVVDNSNAMNCVNLTDVTLGEGNLSLFAQSREVIEAYYQRQTQAVQECKVIFLGDGAAGKSSLIERMVHGNFTPDSLPTDGVKMTKWNTTIEDKPFTLRFLDFGGQEIMHSMHRCFLTAHTVYVVVCESRDDTEIDSVAARWLETVKAFAPGCPVILALNKADLNANVSVNKWDLGKRNPDLKTVLKTSAAQEPGDEYGVSKLIAAIRAEIPGCINNYKANADMMGIKRELEDMTEDYISSEAYQKICARHNITDRKLQRSMLGFFKDLGVAYYYESEALNPRLDSIRVLNPAWLTNGIYRLILRTKESGFLSHKTIKETLRATNAGDILRDKVYTPEETEYILYVMRMFEISHYIGGGVEMIPLKMPKTTPENAAAFPRQDALHLRWEGSYLPNNLIHRLMIRKFPELDTKCVWRTGGHFWQGGGNREGGGNASGCEALAEMNDNALDVYVIGSRDCRQYMEAFRSEIQNILSALNIRAEEVICCTIDGREGYIPYKDVIDQYHKRPQSDIYIPGIGEYISPLKLLRETYVNWEKEAQQRGFSDRVIISPTISPVISPTVSSTSSTASYTPQESQSNDNPSPSSGENAEHWANVVKTYFGLMIAVAVIVLLVIGHITGKIDFWEILKAMIKKASEWLLPEGD